MHIFRTCAPVLFMLATLVVGISNRATGQVIVQQGYASGQLTKSWLKTLESRMAAEGIDSFAALNRPVSGEEEEWRRLIESRATHWNTIRDSLATAFRPIRLADTICVLLGFLGNDDGFTYGGQTVCLDLTALLRAYGPATLHENHDRVDRIFSHEYTHLLHKEWAKRNNYSPKNTRDEVLWECFYEGLGMYRSLNDKWKPVNGRLPKVTLETLERLVPIFTDHMRTINARPDLGGEEKRQIQKNLSRGMVSQKWGAFPVAIWLLLEAEGDERNLQQWVERGPMAVMELAKKYVKEARF